VFPTPSRQSCSSMHSSPDWHPAGIRGVVGPPTAQRKALSHWPLRSGRQPVHSQATVWRKVPSRLERWWRTSARRPGDQLGYPPPAPRCEGKRPVSPIEFPASWPWEDAVSRETSHEVNGVREKGHSDIVSYPSNRSLGGCPSKQANLQ